MSKTKTMSLKEVLIRFAPFYKEYKFYFAISIVGMLLAAAGTALSAWMIEPILDKIFVAKDITLLYYTPFLVVIVYVVKSSGIYLQSYYISFIGTDILRKLREEVLRNIIYLDMKFFQRYRSGELISRCTNDIGALQSIVSSIIPEFFRELIYAVGLLGVVIYQSPKLAFFALIVIPAAAYPLVLFAKKLKKLGVKTQEKNSDLTSRLNEIFSNIELIKSNNSQEMEMNKFKKENQEFCNFSLKNARIDALISPLMEIMGSFGVVIVIIVGGKEVIDGSMSTGAFFSFLTALFLIYRPIKKLSSLYGRLQGAIAASERTFYLLDLRSELKGGDKKLENIEKIAFKDVCFAYDEQRQTLKNVNFEFKRGEILALAGPSGGGKSSIIALLMYFFDKKSGQILFNDDDISTYNTNSLRQKIALVTQNIYLFNDTIANNIAYSEEFSEERVIKALKDANAYEFVEQMGGMNAMILEHGKNLSGGQKQRIAIARALYKNPDLLIFDEATSALDNESEKAIVKIMENLKKDKLVLVIAHRLSTIENADCIVMIDKGEIIGMGSDKHLLQTCELYKKFKQKSMEKNEE
ncbi:ABC transporter ATP-binding protein [Campylobacter sp. MIT 99-7217]|uniref:ABC transporter ATP-binding protein n=1 Tax=Campylobacter sp. MIT 99-7217 TaxID=535091 RepID=UPI0021AF4B36|nr:ABC transporter ATP-binding protein [Campylobacter sp. MIT 99-7217]